MGSGGIAPPFLTLPLDGDECSVSRPGHFALAQNSQYPLDRRLGGPQSRSWRCGKEKPLAPAGNRTPSRPAYSPSLCRITLDELSRKYIQVVRDTHKHVYKKICSVWLIYFTELEPTGSCVNMLFLTGSLSVCFVFPRPLSCAVSVACGSSGVLLL
jgi:hypothetical protein